MEDERRWSYMAVKSISYAITLSKFNFIIMRSYAMGKSKYGVLSLFLVLVFGAAFLLGSCTKTDDTKSAKKMITKGVETMIEGRKLMVNQMILKDMIKEGPMMEGDKKMKEGKEMLTDGQSMMDGENMMEGKQKIVEGATMMTDGWKMISDEMAKEGLPKKGMMLDGEKMITKGHKSIMDGLAMMK